MGLRLDPQYRKGDKLMNGVAALSEEERNELFTLTAQQRSIGSVAIIEKDFWVCWTLKQLFEHPKLAPLLIFKGGRTSGT